MKRFWAIFCLIVVFGARVFANAGGETAGNEGKSTNDEERGANAELNEIKTTEIKPNRSAKNDSRPVVSTEFETLSTPIYRIKLYDTTTISQEDLNEAVSYYSSQLGYQVQPNEVLEDIIDNVLFKQVLEKALKDGELDVYDGDFNNFVSSQLQLIANQYGVVLSNNEEATAFLSQFDSNYEKFANDCLTSWAQQKYIEKHSNGALSSVEKPSQNEIEKYYKDNISKFVGKEYAKVAQIFIAFSEDKNADYEKIREVYDNLSNNSITFEKAAFNYSEDTDSSENGGVLSYWIPRDNEMMKKAFGDSAMEAIFALDSGEISSIVEGAQGYHIFKGIVHKDSALLKLDDLYNQNASYTVRDVIEQQLTSDAYQEVYYRVYENIIKDLRSKATLESLI